jgi:hypothetical protein
VDLVTRQSLKNKKKPADNTALRGCQTEHVPSNAFTTFSLLWIAVLRIVKIECPFPIAHEKSRSDAAFPG